MEEGLRVSKCSEHDKSQKEGGEENCHKEEYVKGHDAYDYSTYSTRPLQCVACITEQMIQFH